MIKRAITMAVLLTLPSVAGAAGSSIQSFNVQGVLRDMAGNLQSANVGLAVNLYAAQNSASSFYTQSFTTVPVENGFFTVELSGGGLAFAGADTWVGIQVSGDPTELPRQHLDAAPYAFSAASANTLSSACAGCVSTSMLAANAKAPLCGSADSATNATTAGNATDLGGQPASAYMLASAASGFEPKLVGAACGSTKYLQSVDAAGNVTCGTDANSGGTVTSVSAAAPLSVTSGTTTPQISLTNPLPVLNGGTGSTTQSFVDLSNAQTVGGAKTFSSSLVTNGSLTSSSVSTTQESVTQQGSHTSDVYTMNVGDSTVNYNAVNAAPNGIIAFPGTFWASGFLTFFPHPTSANVVQFEFGARRNANYNDVPANLNVTGSVSAAGVTLTSDERLKKDVEPLHDALAALDSLHGVRFRWKSSDERDLGLIAQDVERVFPELVKRDRRGYRSVAYGNLVAVVIEALKQSRAEEAVELRALRAENATLADRLSRLEERLAEAPRKSGTAVARVDVRSLSATRRK